MAQIVRLRPRCREAELWEATGRIGGGFRVNMCPDRHFLWHDRAMPEPNVRLRQARLRVESPNAPGEPASRQDIAELVNAWVWDHRGRRIELDGNYIGKLERGVIKSPQNDYRAALRHITRSKADSDLGFRRRAMPASAAPVDAESRDLTGTSSVAALRQELNMIDRRYQVTPSAALLAEAGQAHARIRSLLSDVNDDQLRRQLLSLQALSATLLGRLVWDASARGDDVSPRSYYNEAIAAAQELGDVVAEGHARLRSSYIHLYGRANPHDPRAGLALAESAVAVANRTSHALAGLGWLHVGEAQAMVGEYRLCERALGIAEQHFENTGDDDPAGNLFSPSQLGRLSGSCYLRLGRPDRAEPILRETVSSLADRRKSRSLVVGNLALSLIQQRKLDETTATLHDAIEILEESRGAAGLNVVFDAGRKLYPWRTEPAVQDVTDRLLALMAVS